MPILGGREAPARPRHHAEARRERRGEDERRVASPLAPRYGGAVGRAGHGGPSQPRPRSAFTTSASGSPTMLV